MLLNSGPARHRPGRQASGCPLVPVRFREAAPLPGLDRSQPRSAV